MRLEARRSPTRIAVAIAGTAVCVLAGCARSPAPTTEKRAAWTVFTDTAAHRRYCEAPDSGRADLTKCVLKDQSRERPAPRPLRLPEPY